MSKISARDIQIFVAGVLAYLGFQSLVWIPYEVVYSQDSLRIIASIVAGVGLLLGVGIVAGNIRALRWAQIFLLVCVLGAVVNICLSVFETYHVFQKAPHMSLYRSIFDFLTNVILLWLLVWSRSKRFRDEPDA
jgi:Na+-driven multidrug efflux pump